MRTPLRAFVATACLISLVSALPHRARAATLPKLPQATASFDVGSLHVQRYGSGAHTIIFVPGLACGPWAWADAIRTFAPHYTVYALTLDGFDGRPYVAHRDLIASFTRDFWTFLAQAHITKPVVVGHSLGGTLTFALAEAHPHRLAGIVALDGLPVFPSVVTMAPAQRTAAAATMASSVSGLSHAKLLAYDTTFMSELGTVHASLVDPVAQLEAQSDPAAVGAWVQADVGGDLRPGLAKITIPVLELMPYAPGSPYTQAQTLAFYQMLVSGAPQATVLPILNAKHFAMLDQPAAVNDAIARFLRTAAW